MENERNIWIIAGESSGDLYGARLAQELSKEALRRSVDLHLSAMGGEELKKTNAKILVDSTELGVVGLIEVFKHIFTFIGIFMGLVRLARREQPDAVVLIDYPGFNLMFARCLKHMNIPVIWYISPHVWTWGKRRIPKLARRCAKMLVIFPFEIEVYAGSGLDTEFVGHPLVEAVLSQRDLKIKRDDNLLLMLPGSRFSEISRLLKPMLETAAEMHRRKPELKFAISVPRRKIYDSVLNAYKKLKKPLNLPEIEISFGKTAYWLQKAGTGLAASGTVTVEAAIAGLPLVVAYRLNWITILVAAMVVKLYRGFFTMVNIIADKEVFEEFLQHRVRADILSDALERIIPGGIRRESVLKDMSKVVADISGSKEKASLRAAKVCLDFVDKNIRKQIVQDYLTKSDQLKKLFRQEDDLQSTKQKEY